MLIGLTITNLIISLSDYPMSLRGAPTRYSIFGFVPRKSPTALLIFSLIVEIALSAAFVTPLPNE